MVRVFLLLPVFLFAGWAEETLERMTLDEKVGQLFAGPACPKRGEDHWDDWMRLMKECHVGNAILKQAGPIEQVRFLNRLQKSSLSPLLILADAEWGLGMRMSDTISYPRNMTLGAVQDIGLIDRMGYEIGRQAKRVGIHMNLAPVADVNNNPLNPIIHMRSFGEDPHEVALRAAAMVRGLQEGGILACPKHFPGHGDTAVDSHHDLPFVPFCRERLEAVELVPFRRTISEGAFALMTAHLFVPAIDDLFPSSLSGAHTRIVREEMGFQGLIVSDALNMGALAKVFTPEEIVLLARKAGCDLLLYGDHLDSHVDRLLRDDLPRAFKALKRAYADQTLDLSELDQSVLRILRAKEKMGLHEKRIVSEKGLLQFLNNPNALKLKRRLYQEAVTLVGASPHLSESAAYLSLGENDVLGSYFTHRFDIKDPNLLEQLESFEQVVIAVHGPTNADERQKLEAFKEKSVILLFATPYSLKMFKDHKSVLIGYENDPDAQEALYLILKGEKRAKGKAPVTIRE